MVRKPVGIAKNLRWLASVNLKILRISPLDMCLVSAFTLIAQVSITLAMLLPLKVLLIMGAGSVPSYFPQAFNSWDMPTLVLSLGCLALVFYALHVISNLIVAKFSEKGAQLAGSKNKKLIVIANQEGRTQSIYGLITSIQAGSIFVSFGFLALWYFYAGLAYFLIAAIIIVSGSHLYISFKRPESQSNLLAIGANVIFLAGFAFMIADFLQGNEFNRYIGLISVILSRQVLSRYFKLVVELGSVFDQKNVIDALFFHGKTYTQKIAKPEERFWTQIGEDQYLGILADAVSKITGKKTTAENAALINVPQVGALSFDFHDPETSQNFLVKLYDPLRKHDWQNEKEILSALHNNENPVPIIVGDIELTSGYVTVLAPSPHRKQTASSEQSTQDQAPQGDNSKQAIWLSIFQITPPSAFVERYRRTHPVSFELLTDAMIQNLSSLCKLADIKDEFVYFEAHWNAIKIILSEIPLVLVNPLFVSGRTDFHDQKIVPNWSRWSLDTAGAGWLWRRSKPNELGDILTPLRIVRPEFEIVEPNQLMLSALVFDLKNCLSGKRWHQAIEVLVELNKITSQLLEPEIKTKIMTNDYQ